MKESWREGDNDDADTWEPWALNDVMTYCTSRLYVEYYDKNQQANIMIVKKTEKDDDDASK